MILLLKYMKHMQDLHWKRYIDEEKIVYYSISCS